MTTELITRAKAVITDPDEQGDHTPLIAELCEALEMAVRDRGDMSRAYDEQTVMIEKLSNDFEKVTGERARLKTNFRRMQRERDEARIEIESINHLRCNANKIVNEQTDELIELQGEINQLRKEIVAMRESIDDQVNEQIQTAHECDKLKTALEISEDTIATLDADNAAAHDEIERLHAVVKTANRLVAAVDACDAEAERHPSSRSSAPMVRYIRALSDLRADLSALEPSNA